MRELSCVSTSNHELLALPDSAVSNVLLSVYNHGTHTSHPSCMGACVAPAGRSATNSM
jgi:hypothetical protein